MALRPRAADAARHDARSTSTTRSARTASSAWPRVAWCSPGKAGTLQEIFQDAAQNYCATGKERFNPMVFLDVDGYWTSGLQVRTVLERLLDDAQEPNLHWVTTAHDAVAALCGPVVTDGAAQRPHLRQLPRARRGARRARPRSDDHDELLFIVIHQVVRAVVQAAAPRAPPPRPDSPTATPPTPIRTLRRILTILKVVVAQIDVLETMSPRQFSASATGSSASAASSPGSSGAGGGARPSRSVRLRALPGGTSAACIEAAMAAPSLWDSYLAYLRTQGFETDEVAPRCSPPTATTVGPPSSPSTSSTSTRASRSGGTDT